MGKGLSPALRPFPSGPKAPLASDLEFIQDNSLLLPPVPAPSAPGLPAQGGGRSGPASLCPDPKGGKKLLEMGISERKAFCSPLPDLCSWMRHPQRDCSPSCPSREKADEQRTHADGGKGKSSLSSQGGTESRALGV